MKIAKSVITSENCVVDYGKIFFATCVVAIHTSLLKDVSPALWYYLNKLIWTMAVPFFYMVSGYFFNPKMIEIGRGWVKLPAQIFRFIPPCFFGQRLSVS